MNKKIILVLLILFCSIVFSSSVDRSFSSPLTEGADLYITLTVSLDTDDTIIAIEETIPNGFTIVDDDGGTSGQQNKLQWICIKNNLGLYYI
jgi:hypothetical protein